MYSDSNKNQLIDLHMEAGECDIDRIVCVVVTKVLLQDLHRNRCLPHFLPLRTISSLRAGNCLLKSTDQPESMVQKHKNGGFQMSTSDLSLIKLWKLLTVLR